MIGNSIASSEQGTVNSGKLSAVLSTILTKSTEVNAAVANIVVSFQGQTDGISQINSAVAQLDNVTQSQAANSEETAGAAAQLYAQSDSLRNLTETLKQIVQGAGAARLTLQ